MVLEGFTHLIKNELMISIDLFFIILAFSLPSVITIMTVLLVRFSTLQYAFIIIFYLVPISENENNGIVHAEKTRIGKSSLYLLWTHDS
jgi:hypothetical protein